MKVSVCITTLDEEKSIGRLLQSLLGQTKRADEIVLVDGGSKDKTVEIARHFQKKDRRIKILTEECSRAEGRNLGVELARNEIVALTDAGCVPKKDWLEKITEPFKHEEVDMVAGFYKMTGDTPLQKAISVFLGVTPRKFGINFLPSTRSVAFRRELWEKIGGFPGKLKGTAEDTVFNYKAIKSGAKIARVKTATVEWGMPENLGEGIKKIYSYAKGDAKSKIWLFPGKGLSSHNIKVLLVLGRYIAGLALLFFFLKNHPLLYLLIFGVLLYGLWAFRKVYLETKDIKSGLWGIVLQFSSDFAVMAGFIKGIIS